MSKYQYVSDLNDFELKYVCQRYSNHAKPEFTDQEIMTIYLFTTSQQRYYNIKEIYTFAKEYLLSWFPKLPSYKQVNYRFNRLSGAIQQLSSNLTNSFLPEGCDLGVSLVDSLSIDACKDRDRSGKLAPEIADKGSCSTENMYYRGMKLYALAFRRKGGIPFPEYLICKPASVLEAFKSAFGDNLNKTVVFGDRSYRDKDYFQEKEAINNLSMLTPHIKM